MAPAVVNTRVFSQPEPFHQEFPRGPPIPLPSIPAGRNSSYVRTKYVDLKRKILFSVGDVRCDTERTPLRSKTRIKGSNVSLGKRRRSGFVRERGKPGLPQKVDGGSCSIARNDCSGNTASELPSSPNPSEPISPDSTEPSGPTLLSVESSGPTSGPKRSDPVHPELPKTAPPTSDESLAVNDKKFNVTRSKLPKRTHGKVEAPCPDSNPKAIAKNTSGDEERGIARPVHSSPECEIPTVVMEFTGTVTPKTKKKKPQVEKDEDITAVTNKRARRDGGDPLMIQAPQMTGGTVFVISKHDENDYGQGTFLSQVPSVSPSERPVSARGNNDCCVPPYENFLAHCKSASGSCDFAVKTIAERSQVSNYPTEGSKTTGTPLAYPESMYSPSYLRSLIPYRPEGFNHYPHMKFKCVFCSQLFPCLDDFQGHVDQRHYGSHPYECPFCRERFDHVSPYSAHLNEHVQLRNYPTFGCPACSASFSSKWELHLHVVAYGHHMQYVPLS